MEGHAAARNKANDATSGSEEIENEKQLYTIEKSSASLLFS
jgi:hypothetical protein